PKEHAAYVAHVRLFAFVEDDRKRDTIFAWHAEVALPEEEVAEDRCRDVIELRRLEAGQRRDACSVLLEADKDRIRERHDGRAEDDQRRCRRDQERPEPAGHAYSASVCAWSHQPWIVRSLGISIFSSSAPRTRCCLNVATSTVRMSFSPSKPLWLSSRCSAAPKPARLSIWASSRQVSTSLVVAPTWSARYW